MSASGQYKIDGLDLFDTYSYVVESASDELIKDAGLKNPPEYDWEDQDGKEYFLDQRFANDKDVLLRGYFHCKNKVEFWQKYTSLLTKLKSPGLRKLYSAELEQTFDAFYKGASSAVKFTQMSSSDIVVRMEFPLTVMPLEYVIPGGKLSQVITFPVIATKTENDADFEPAVSASSGLSVNLFSSNPSVATIINGKTIHITGIGTTVITAQQLGNDTYNPATDKTRVLTVIAFVENNKFPYTFPFNLS